MRNENQHVSSVTSRFARMTGMRQAFHEITIATHGKGLVDFTPQVLAWVRGGGIERGLLTLYIRHTSASLLIQENHDQTVQSDLERFLSRLVPEGDPIYEHILEVQTTCRRMSTQP